MSTREKHLVSHAVSSAVLHLAMALCSPPRRVRKNKDGDWIGYEGRARVYNFGISEFAAKAWEESNRSPQAIVNRLKPKPNQK